MLGDQVVQMAADGVLQFLPLELVQQLAQGGEIDHLADADLLRVKVHKVLQVDHVVRKHLDLLTVHVDDSLVDAPVVQEVGPLPCQDLSLLGDDLAGAGIGYGQGQLLAGQPGPQSHLLVELIAAHSGQIIAPGIKEGGVQQGPGGVHRGGLARTELAVDLQQGVLIGLTGILLHRGQDTLVLAEHLDDFSVGPGPQGTDKAGDGQLAVLIDADIEQVGQIGFILQPGTPVGDDGSGVGQVVRLVRGPGVIHTGRADDLGDDDPFGAIDDEGAGLGHDGEVSHKDLLLGDLLRHPVVLLLGVAQLDLHLDGGGVGGVPGLALLHVVLGLLVHGVVHKGQLQIAGIVGDGADVLEHLPQAGVQEPLVGGLLHLQQVRHLQDLLVAGKALSRGLAVHYVLDHAKKSTRFLLIPRLVLPFFPLDAGKNSRFRRRFIQIRHSAAFPHTRARCYFA